MKQMEHANLTVVSSGDVYTHQGKYYIDESEYACNGVDLPNGIDYSSARTWTTKPNRNGAMMLTHIVQGKGRCLRMTLHS